MQNLAVKFLLRIVVLGLCLSVVFVLSITFFGENEASNTANVPKTVKSLGESSFYTLNADDSLAKWWSSDDRVRLNTAKMVVNKMMSNNLLNSHGSSVNTIAYEMTNCVNFATEGLYEIFQSETIGSAMLSCAIELGYM
ncbi:hypothetical protein ACMU90_003408 [Vibrio cholerae]